MSEPFDNPQPLQATDKPGTGEPQACRDDGKPKGVCSHCVNVVYLEAILKVGKDAHCPHCGARFVNFNW